MERATITTISFILFLSFPFKVSSLDSLKQGETLNSSVQLVSAKKIFTLGFYSPQNANTNYLGIWYTEFNDSPVWLANRDKPIHNGSAALTVDSSGKLMIIHGGGDPIELYAAANGTNITATLLDTGNFVVKEVMISSNGSSSSGRILWESFHYPTDTLLPGMKLGINHETGRNWTLTSWFSDSNPASGAFTLEWDWIRRRVVVRRRGVVYWTSGDLKFYYQFKNLKVYAFDYIVPHPDPLNLNYIFRNVSNQGEEFFEYSLYADDFTPERRRTVSGWRLYPQGNIFDFDRVSVAMVELCYGYNTRGSETYLGCELWQQPKCRNNHQNFTVRYGYFPLYTQVYDNNSALDASDCRANCWNDCECVGFKAEETGEDATKRSCKIILVYHKN